MKIIALVLAQSVSIDNRPINKPICGIIADVTRPLIVAYVTSFDDVVAMLLSLIWNRPPGFLVENLINFYRNLTAIYYAACNA